ncbi:MAG: polymer-forming cytoskeletal protein, partial [Chthoniobacteraceae bacterium]
MSGCANAFRVAIDREEKATTMPEELATISNGESLPPVTAGSDEAWIFPSRLEDITKLFRDAHRDHSAKLSDPSRLPSGESTAPDEQVDADASEENEPRIFDDLFRRLRAGTRARHPAGSDYKQFITHFADRVRIDWEGLLHGRTWQDLTTTEIEDAIVLAIFQKACSHLTDQDRAQLAASLAKTSGNPNMLGGLLSSGALILAKLPAPHIQLLRTVTWELSRTGTSSSANELDHDAKSAILGNVEITGSITFRGELVFNGSLKSGAITGDTLQVGRNAKIKGDILVDTLTLSGKVTGNTTATQKCELDSTAQITGTL